MFYRQHKEKGIFLLKVCLGSFLYAVGFQYFLYPNAIVSGGVTGIAMILNLLTRLPVGILIIVINIPLFLVAWKQFGFRFIQGSFMGMLLSSVFVDVLSLYPLQITTEPMLGAMYGGVFMGFGLGIVYTTGATTGGIDIAVKLLRKKLPHINFGTLMLSLDAVIIGIFAVVFQEFENALYAVISVFVVSKLVDFVLYGAVNSKLCYIITEHETKIKQEIHEKLERGATMLQARGAYTNTEKQVILCAISRRQIVQLRRIIYQFDPEAFIIVCDAHAVFGLGFADIDEV